MVHKEDNNNTALEMPYLKNIGLLMTYKCQVECPHCIIKAGPNRKEEIALEETFNWIEQISRYRNGHIKFLSLTGGEPFCNIEYLKKISDYGKGCGLFITAVSNAFWAISQKKAIEVLKELTAIRMLSFSADAYHQKSIPFERVKNAVEAAEKCNIPYNISVCTEDENDSSYKEILKQLYKITEKDNIFTTIVFNAGRALKEVCTSKYQLSKKPPISACSSAGSPVIFPDGKVIACIGPIIDLKNPHPLVLGDLRVNSLEEIFDNAEMNPILHTLRVWGPKKLISLIKEKGLDQCIPDNYIKDSICNTCYELMSNSKMTDYFASLANDLDFQEKVAYARAYYLKETTMINALTVLAKCSLN